MTQLLAHLFGDYILQSDWMAQNKTKRSWPALVHALLYSLCFVWLCWIPGYVMVHNPPCITYLDGRGGETPCVSEGLRIPENAHGYNVYATRPAVDIVHKGYFRWLPWLVIFSTHFLINRFRLARYVVWAKNWMGPKQKWYYHWNCDMWIQDHPGSQYAKYSEYECFLAPTPPLWACPTGHPPTTPVWLSTWLLIIADNTLHLAINYAALRWL
jgi:hypothetical protein